MTKKSLESKLDENCTTLIKAQTSEYFSQIFEFRELLFPLNFYNVMLQQDYAGFSYIPRDKTKKIGYHVIDSSLFFRTHNTRYWN